VQDLVRGSLLPWKAILENALDNEVADSMKKKEPQEAAFQLSMGRFLHLGD
jgi:hypothetical protein